VHTDTTYAGIWRRFWALVIDGLLFCAVFFPVTRVVRARGRGRMTLNTWSLDQLEY